MKPTRGNFAEFAQWLFAERGAESYLGEQVTMAEHMLQAAVFAEREGAAEHLIVAALLHDVGHFTGAFGDDFIERGVDNLHEDAGADVLRPFFPPEITEPIRLHVAAKKYLCAAQPEYYSALSEASRKTLQLQGGAMSEKEMREFEKRPHFEPALRLRKWDDAGKVPGMQIPKIARYLPMITRALLPENKK